MRRVRIVRVSTVVALALASTFVLPSPPAVAHCLGEKTAGVVQSLTRTGGYIEEIPTGVTGDHNGQLTVHGSLSSTWNYCYAHLHFDLYFCWNGSCATQYYYVETGGGNYWYAGDTSNNRPLAEVGELRDSHTFTGLNPSDRYCYFVQVVSSYLTNHKNPTLWRHMYQADGHETGWVCGP